MNQSLLSNEGVTETDLSDAARNRKKAIEDAEIKYLMEMKAQEDKLLLTHEMEQKARMHQLELNRQQELNEQQNIKQREQDLVNLINSINSNISDADRKPMSSIPNFTTQLTSYGYQLLTESSSSRLGDCFNGLIGVPVSIVTKHRNLTSSGNSYDNRYLMYEENNKKYIIGCHRCLELWNHKCKVVVYVK
jgi:hypothetical protein